MTNDQLKQLIPNTGGKVGLGYRSALESVLLSMNAAGLRPETIDEILQTALDAYGNDVVATDADLAAAAKADRESKGTPPAGPDRRRVLVTVSGGVAETRQDPGVEVVVFDWDNYNDDPSRYESTLPAHFADLAKDIDGIPIDPPAAVPDTPAAEIKFLSTYNGRSDYLVLSGQNKGVRVSVRHNDSAFPIATGFGDPQGDLSGMVACQGAVVTADVMKAVQQVHDADVVGTAKLWPAKWDDERKVYVKIDLATGSAAKEEEDPTAALLEQAALAPLGVMPMLAANDSVRALAFRQGALSLLESASAVDGLQPYTVVHGHKHGEGVYLAWSKSTPTVAQVCEACGIDFEPDRDESISIDSLNDPVRGRMRLDFSGISGVVDPDVIPADKEGMADGASSDVPRPQAG